MRIRRAIDRISHRGAEVAAIGTAGVGLFALGTWAFDQWRFTAFGLEYVPMAPSTAVLFVLLGLAMGVCHRWPDVRPVRIIAVASAIITLVVSALVAAQSWSYFPLPWDGWLTHPDLRASAIPPGRMSPLTAAAFLLSAGSLLARALGPPVTRLLRWSAAIAAGAGLLVGLIIALGYAAGTPLFYGGQTVPMALLTAITFVVLNVGLLLFNGAVSGLLDWLALGLDSDVSETQRRFVWRLLTILAGLVAAISLTGFFYLKRQQTSARAHVYNNLNAIADLKMAQIVNWRNERLVDGRFLFQAPFVARDVTALFTRPESVEVRTGVSRWLDLMRMGGLYESAMLFDAQMNLRLELPGSTAIRTPGPILRGHLAAALRSNDAFLTDLHRADAGDPIHLDLIVPVIPSDLAPTATNPPPALSRPAPIAVIVLWLDPERFLFPLIQTWPTPSATAETLLVRREGDEVVYLNELRHRKGTALALRFPVSDPLLPAAMIARGERGVFEGIDYRGVPVLAAVRAVPDSPWMLVTKVDQAEAYATIRAEAWRTGLMVGLLLVAVVLAAAYLWRQRHAALLHHELTLERERKALAERLALITRHANDIILLLDETGRIVEANDRALATYGYTLDELRRLPPGGLQPPGTQENLPQQLDLFASREGAVFETVHRHRDGTTFPVEVSGRSVEIEGRQFSLGIYRDLTERKQAAEAQQLAHERLRRFVDSNVVGIVIADAAGAVVEANDYYLRLIGYTREELEHGKTDWRAITPPEWLPADKQALGELRERGTCTPYEKEYVRRDGTRVSVFLADTMLPGPGEQIAAFALDITARKQAEAALRESEQRYRAIGESMDYGVWVCAPDGRNTYASESFLRLVGITQEQCSNFGWGDVLHPEDAERTIAAWKECVRTDGNWDIEHRIRGVDGKWHAVLARGVPVRDAQGKITCWVGINLDISRLKQAEAARCRAEEQYRAIFENAIEGIYQTTPQGTFLAANPAMARILGYASPEELIRERTDIARQGYVDPHCREEFTRRIEADGVVSGFEYEAYRRDGSKVWVFENARGVRDRHGQVVCYEGSLNDITERKRAEEALKLFRALVDRSSDAIEVLDPETGRFLDVNERDCLDLGYSREEFLALRVFDIDPMVNQSAFIKVAEELRKSGVLAWDGIHRRKDGSTFPVEVNLKYVRFDHDYMIAMVRDITERKRGEAALRQQTEALRTRNEELARFNRAAVGRELRMVELKQQVNELCRQLGQPLSYPLDFLDAESPASTAAETSRPKGESET